MLLVVGATGQLGGLVVRRLREDGQDVRALVRTHGPAAEDLLGTGATLALGDLRDARSLERALIGVDGVVATATAVAPSRAGDTHPALRRGYADLIQAAAAAGVGRFVYSSVAVTPLDDVVPEFGLKRFVEEQLASAPLSSLSLRLAPFIEVWPALVGSSVPLRGERHPTLERPYAFLRAFRRVTGTTVEQHGVLVVPGPSTNRNAFISVHDVAELLVAALREPELTGAVDVGGPEALSWDDVAATFRDVLQRPTRVVSVPPAVFAAGQRALAPWAPAAANIMGLNRTLGTTQTDWDTRAVTDRLGVTSLRTLRQVLSEKAALPV